MSQSGKRHHIERADQVSWFLLLFGVVRMVAWVIMMCCVGAGLLHVPGFGWAANISGEVFFVSLISFYANAATDLDAVTAAWAAIRAGKAHAQGVQNESVVRDDVLARVEALQELIYEHQLREENE